MIVQASTATGALPVGDWLLSPAALAICAALMSALILTGVYARLWRLDHQRYLLLWLGSWIASDVRYTFALGSTALPDAPLLRMATNLAALAAALLLLAGAYEFMERRLPRYFIFGTGATAIWVVVGVTAAMPFPLLTAPVFAYLAAANIIAGWTVLRWPGYRGAEKRITAWVLILWGIHRANYPILGQVAWFVPIGFMLTAGFELVVAVGSLLMYLQRARDSLTESEQRYRSLFEGALEGIFRSSTDGQLRMVNPALVRMLGYSSADEMMQRRLPEHIDLDPLNRPDLLRQIAESRRPGGVEARLKKKDGSTILASVHAHRAYNPASGESYFEGTILDVTERTRTREVLEYHIQFETLITSLSARFIRLTPDEIDTDIGDALQVLGEFAGVDRAYVFLFDDDSQQRVSNTHEWSVPGISAEIANLQGMDVTRIAWLMDQLQRHEVVYVPRVADLPLAAASEKAILEAQSIRSLIMVPMLYAQSLIGFFGFDSVREEKTWPEDIILLLRITGEIFANAVQRKRAEESLRRYQSELQAKTESLQIINTIADTLYRYLDFSEVIERVLDAVIGYLPVQGASIRVLDEERGVLRRLGGRTISPELAGVGVDLPVSSSFNGLAVTSRDIIFSPDVGSDDRIEPSIRQAMAAQGSHCAIIVPLLFQDQVKGTLNLILADKHDLAAHERQTLLSIGKTIALALVNARYLERIESEVWERQQTEASERAQRFLAEALRDTAAALNSQLELDKVLEVVLDHVRRVIPNDLTNIFVIQDGVATNARFEGYSQRGLYEMMTNLRLRVQDTPNFRWMIENGKPLAIPDTFEYEGWRRLADTRWIRSCVSAPIRIENQVIGFINLDSATPNTFNESDAHRLQAFADQASIAIRNAQLYDRVRRQAAELEQRVAERTAELETERAQLRAILDGMGEGVIGVIVGEASMNTWYVNRALCDLTGYRPDEIDLYTLKSDALGDEQYLELTRDIFDRVRQDGIWKGEIRVRCKNGLEFDASMTGARVDASDGQMVGAAMIVRDISQEKALQEQKSRFVSNASHELRTPITNLKTRLYLAQRVPERLPEHLEVLEQITDRMKNLVEDLLDVSRFERGVIELRQHDISLRDLIADVVRVQQPEAEGKGILLSSIPPIKPLVVSGDAGRLAQVITNLVVNAINYTPTGGCVTISALNDLDDSGSYARVEVEDTGQGIPLEHLPHIFKPFYRASKNSGGTGLGLSIAKEIVELHQGEIGVICPPDRGACFWVRLPLIADGLESRTA